MLEMKVFRENPDSIFDDLKRRNASAEIVKEVIKLDKKWRVLIEEGNKLRAERNSISKEIGELKKQGKDAKAVLEKMSGIKDKLSQNEKETKEMLNLRDQTRMRVPNILETDVPVGENDEGNKEIGSHGSKRSITNPKPHQEIIENIGGADLKRAAKISGRRFYFLTGDLARLEMALINYAVDYLCQNQYTLTIPPFFMNREAYEGVVDLNDFEEVMYKIDEQDFYLIATSEHPLTARFKDEILEIKEQPLKYAGISTNFRKEVGAHGLSDRGIWRVHQFAKVEQVIICKPEDSKKMHQEILNNAIELFKGLEIPFRIVDICTGDIGTVAARKYDLEAWMPASQQWKEIVSASNCKSYQSVRLNMRYRTPDGTEYPHTLNATAIATTRALAAILENNQQTDGSIIIPKALRKWMNNQEKIEPQ
ncbi:MAG: serine--tRNA ligase [Gammaproteobacteria bacterium]|mgnify:CR=1 FL=1|nr:serine--tRNA ligase [Candidatus Poseidoniia archaeon]MCH2652669.1 serine--tRNA ligase [Gammaproteobacteria bacterium]|tara:strand:+ start:291 stop:1559 length:1269 start_codon:yes stop_codon:yes gene_type:complete